MVSVEATLGIVLLVVRGGVPLEPTPTRTRERTTSLGAAAPGWVTFSDLPRHAGWVVSLDPIGVRLR